ncbi:hypothetical protein sos41_39600 [Alphaproteobacteria bacterium SO-S41]|nr:hypothetical protein sos41_39600 [Alphaproteobacteria bacterium SO-S41]
MSAASYLRIAAVVCAALLPVPEAAAVSCPVKTADQEIEGLDLIFIGGALKDEDVGGGKTRTVFRVDEVLLGAPMATVDIYQDAEDGIAFESGSAPQLVGAKKQNDHYWTSLCINPLSGEAEVREALKKAQSAP